MDQHEPAGEDQYIPELEEGEQGYTPELRPGKPQKQVYQRNAGEQVRESESAPGGHYRDPTADQICLLEAGETPEQGYESDSEPGEQMYDREAGGRPFYDSDSDSEPEDQTPPQELERNKQGRDSESAGKTNHREAEGKQSRLEPGERAYVSHRGEQTLGAEAQDEEQQQQQGEEDAGIEEC